MGPGCPPLKIKDLLESDPLKSRCSDHELTVPASAKQQHSGMEGAGGRASRAPTRGGGEPGLDQLALHCVSHQAIRAANVPHRWRSEVRQHGEGPGPLDQAPHEGLRRPLSRPRWFRARTGGSAERPIRPDGIGRLRPERALASKAELSSAPKAKGAAFGGRARGAIVRCCAGSAHRVGERAAPESGPVIPD